MANKYSDRLREILDQYAQLKVWEYGSDAETGYIGGLQYDDYTLTYCYGQRPYRVIWLSCGDRKINGQYKATEFVRSRSFGKLESALKFMGAIK